MGVLWQRVISGGVHGGVQRGVFSQGGDPVCGFFYVRYAVSYRDLEEIMAERGVAVEHATLNRWVVRYAPQIVCKARSSKRSVCRSWRMDETCVKVRGQWVYLYRSVAKHGEAVDLMLSTRRRKAVLPAGDHLKRCAGEGCYRQGRQQSGWLAMAGYTARIHPAGAAN